MEELLAQLLQQRALQTKAESDARHGPAIQALLAPPPRVEDRPARTPVRVHPQDRMPVMRPDVIPEAQANDIAALRERGQPIPEYMYQGLSEADIAGAHKLGSEMQGYGGEPMLKPLVPGFKDPTERTLGLAAEDPMAGFVGGREKGLEVYDNAELAKRQKAARVRDEYVRLHGNDAGIFEGMSEMEAARAIADQLQARRERLGDPGAWVEAAGSTYGPARF